MEILLIDDEKVIRDTLAVFLSEEGYSVRTAGTGEDGLWYLQEKPADIVLTDLKMPGMSGLEVLQRIREAWPGTEVVLITGFATVEDAQEALRRGAYDFLLKPIRLAHLESVMRRCSERIRYARDNRELRSVVERLKELNERKEKFVSMANHELRTPTTVAAGLVSLLASRATALPPELSDLVRRIDAAHQRLREVVEDLGDLALAQTAGIQIRMTRERLSDVVKAVRDLCDLYRDVRNLTIEVRCEAPEDLELLVDRRKLNRALGALIQNGVKYTPDGGQVTVRLNREGANLFFNVEDTGVGVPESEAQKIFDLFYEVADTRHHRTSSFEFKGGGLGVGLPLASAIAAAHGGALRYGPRPQGGSVFSLSLPIASAR